MMGKTQCYSGRIFVLMWCALFTFFVLSSVHSAVPKDKILFKSNSKGWMLGVNGHAYFIKGVVWSYTPIGQKYNYNLFEKPDSVIRATIDRDMTLMQGMRVNTIRTGPIPAKWVEYIYENYDIRSIINHSMGRYGYTIDGKWTFPVDYSDPKFRRLMVKDMAEMAEMYKDVNGVLLIAFGNENNYGLEWSSTEIQDLPVGEQHKARAHHLYTLFEEVFKAVKKVNPHQPVGLVNGDVQYKELIKELCPSMDFFAANSYRGGSVGPLFKDVAETLDKPIVFMEIGCDAFNTLTNSEDQESQALFYRDQWKDIYENSYGYGVGNCVGATIFQWADEWWKLGQEYNLSSHETEGSWSHEGFYYDYKEGVKNMQEEWWGICSISRAKLNGTHLITPRLSYYVMQKVWSLTPYQIKDPLTIDKYFAALEISPEALANEEQGEGQPPAAGQIAKLPLIIYDDYSPPDNQPFIPSGFMGNQGSLVHDEQWTENPQSGKTCIRVAYNASSDWAGLVWQCPANDWGSSPRGWNLSGAKALSFWARGEKGGELVKFELGILGKQFSHPDSDHATLGVVQLTDKWSEYVIPLDGKDLSFIKSGFVWSVESKGQPVTYYLDNIRYVGQVN